MGPPSSVVEYGSAHIGGAKSIRLDNRRQPRRSVSAVRNRPACRHGLWWPPRATHIRVAVRCVRHRLWKAHL